ncbi:MAG: hypothetical protein JSW39_20005, partial [Desulfobacterales bacterium]
MELAVHLRDPEQIGALESLPRHWPGLDEAGAVKAHHGTGWLDRTSRRLYVGDEFCVHRLPRLDELHALVQLAEGKAWGVTFLTPPLTDEGIERCSPLFDYLQQRVIQAEIVVNDWGVLLFLQERYPGFDLSVGRLLNKGFKDPRLLDPDQASRFAAATGELLKHCTFDDVEFQAKMRDLQVRRLERDLLPFGTLDLENLEGLATSVYFPFGYVTTGRVCWIASFGQSAGKKFALSNGCSR